MEAPEPSNRSRTVVRSVRIDNRVIRDRAHDIHDEATVPVVAWDLPDALSLKLTKMLDT